MHIFAVHPAQYRVGHRAGVVAAVPSSETSSKVAYCSRISSSYIVMIIVLK